MSNNDIFNIVSKELNIPVEVVSKAYKSYWEFIRKIIESLPLKDNISEEEFSKLRTNFNIPSLGKLCVTWDRFIGCKKKFEMIKRLRKNV